MSALLGITARAVLYTMLGVILVVMILFGLMLYLLLKTKKKSDSVDNNIRYLLARRESQIVVEIMQCEHDDVKRAELVGKLRRVKMAEMLIEELIKEEQGIVSAVEAEENAKRKHPEKAAAPANKPPVPPAGRPDEPRPAVKPEDMSKVNVNGAPRPVGQPVQRPAGQPMQRPGQPPVQRPAGPVQSAQAPTKPVTEKPAQPAAKPVQAAEKPVEKPAEKPAAQPEKPGASAPASDKKDGAADKGAEEKKQD